MTNEQPTHLDLFSGIGGFALAAKWAGFKTIGFCERESFCQKLLSQHWPEVPIFSDICNFDGKQFEGVSLLTGGFPCQPFSSAGKRRGKEDDRYLWPEMLRVIQETKPCWVLGENVTHIDGVALDDAILDLEASGYETAPPFEIPACAIDKDHYRPRIWILGYSDSNSKSGRAVNAEASGLPQVQADSYGGEQKMGRNMAGAWGSQELDQEINYWKGKDSPLGMGMADGIPQRLDRLRSLGNAIVPAVAYQIIKEIRKLI